MLEVGERAPLEAVFWTTPRERAIRTPSISSSSFFGGE